MSKRTMMLIGAGAVIVWLVTRSRNGLMMPGIIQPGAKQQDPYNRFPFPNGSNMAGSNGYM